MGKSANRLVDIARLSGVSIGTVDRVIHDRGRVSNESKRRVEEAILELEYQPNIMARSLRMKEIADVQVFIPITASDEFWQLSRKGIESEIENWSHYGINTQIIEFEFSEEMALEDYTRKLDRPTGLVVAPVGKAALKLLEWSSEIAVPTTLFNSTYPGFTPLSFSGQDLFQSGRLAADLISASRASKNRCAILHIDKDFDTALYLKEKESGFASRAREQGLEFVNHLLRTESDIEELDHLLTDPSLGALYISTSNGTSVVSKKLKAINRKDLVVVGYDMLEANVNGIKEGYLDYLINQNPGRMAAMALSDLLNYLILRKSIPARRLFPLDIITAENVESYRAFRNDR